MEAEDDLQENYSDPHSGDEEEDENVEDSEDEDSEEEEGYSRNNFVPPDTEFQDEEESIRPEFGINDDCEALEILQLFLDDQIIAKIVEETNRYGSDLAVQNNKWNWKDTDCNEVWRFLAVCILMGIVKKPSIRDYWSSQHLLNTPAFGKIMSRDRFCSIHRAFHLNNNHAVLPTNTDRYVKLGSFMKSLTANFKTAINPSEFLCIDETLLAFKGRLSFLQYNPKKRARFGMKHFILADCSLQFVLDILPYQGKSTAILDRNWIKDYGFGGAAVLSLMSGFEGKSHKLVLDNWFLSPRVVRRLKENSIYALGTVQKRRKDMPVMTGKMAKGAIEIYSNSDFLIERWMDRREVVMINSFMEHSMEVSDSMNPNNTREKPRSVLVYNATMGAVDCVDKTVKPYQSVRKSYKWYKKVFFNLVDIAIYNSFVLYCAKRSIAKKDYMSFVLKVIEQILEKYAKDTPARGRPPQLKARRCTLPMPMRFLDENGKPKNSDCHYCKLTLNRKRKGTSYGCETCQKRLCIQGKDSCFKKFHIDSSARPRVVMGPISNNSQLSQHQ